MGRYVFGCEVLWGAVKGAQIRETVEGIIGGPCACAQGERCPVLGDGRDDPAVDALRPAAHRRLPCDIVSPVR